MTRVPRGTIHGLIALGAALGAALAVAPLAGCQSVSISPEQLASAKERYYAAASLYGRTTSADDFIHAGHRGGAVDEFADRLSGAELDPPNPRDVVALMDRSFGELGLTAIEIDVQPSPLDDAAVVVAHGRIDGADLTEPARRYIRRNTLASVLDHFVAKGWHARGRRLLIELKAPYGHGRPDELADHTVELISRTAVVLTRFDDRPDALAIRRAISILSFHPIALARLHAAVAAAREPDAAGPGGDHGWLLLLTSNQFPRFFFRMSTLPPLDASSEEHLVEPWLTGTILDPIWIDEVGRLLRRVQQRRRRAGLAPLDVLFGTYSSDLEEWAAALAKATWDGAHPIENVRGVVYEIRRD